MLKVVERYLNNKEVYVLRTFSFSLQKKLFYHILHAMNETEPLSTIAFKNISSVSNSDTYLYFQSYWKIIKNECNTVNKKCRLDLDVAYRIYKNISDILKHHQRYDSIDNIIDVKQKLYYVK